MHFLGIFIYLSACYWLVWDKVHQLNLWFVIRLTNVIHERSLILRHIGQLDFLFLDNLSQMILNDILMFVLKCWTLLALKVRFFLTFHLLDHNIAGRCLLPQGFLLVRLIGLCIEADHAQWVLLVRVIECASLRYACRVLVHCHSTHAQARSHHSAEVTDAGGWSSKSIRHVSSFRPDRAVMQIVAEPLTPSKLTCLNLLVCLAPTGLSSLLLSRVDGHAERVLKSYHEAFRLQMRLSETIMAHTTLHQTMGCFFSILLAQVDCARWRSLTLL